MTKKRVLHILGSLVGLAALATGTLPEVVPLAAALGIKPAVLTGIGAVCAFITHLPTALGTGSPGVPPTGGVSMTVSATPGGVDQAVDAETPKK